MGVYIRKNGFLFKYDSFVLSQCIKLGTEPIIYIVLMRMEILFHFLFVSSLIIKFVFLLFSTEIILKLHLTRKLYNSSNFRWLTLENNQLSALPDKFSGLKSLTHLNLKNNCLKQFPKQLCAIESLRYCYLCSNNIEWLNDDYLNGTTFMKLLDINDNPFPDDNLNYKVNSIPLLYTQPKCNFLPFEMFYQQQNY